MNFYASVKDENGNIIIIRDSDYKTKREFKETLSMNGYKIRFVCIDDDDIIDYEAEKYEYKLQKARENAKYRREWLKAKHAEPVEEVPKAEPVGDVENAELIENEIMNISSYKLNNIYDLIEHLEHFLTKRELVTTISNEFNISNELAVELYNIHIRDMYLDDIE